MDPYFPYLIRSNACERLTHLLLHAVVLHAVRAPAASAVARDSVDLHSATGRRVEAGTAFADGFGHDIFGTTLRATVASLRREQATCFRPLPNVHENLMSYGTASA